MQTLSINQLAGQTLGNYRIERFQGQGRLNAIYLARHLVTQRLDALTFYLVPERFSSATRTRFLLRFRKEAAAITSLEHLHILPVYEYGELAGCPYLVTPYMMHGSLVDLLKQHGRYDHHALLPILKQLVAGLTYAHSSGFIHGTLRPSTIVLDPGNTLRVAGFGLMHMLQLGGIEPSERLHTPYVHLLSIAETLLVTPEYVAPEVAQGQSIDVRSDVYALGCILFELLSGQPPFTGKDPLDIIGKHVTEAAPSLRVRSPEVPIALASVVNQALARDPAKRFQHVLELLEAFQQASRGAISWAVPGTTSAILEYKQNEDRKDIPRDSYSAQKWQLVPPIVTGKVLAVRLSEQGSPVSSLQSQGINTDRWRAVPPMASDKMPSVAASVPQQENTSLTAEQEAVLDLPTQLVNTDRWCAVPPIVTEQFPAVASSKIPSLSSALSSNREETLTTNQAFISDLSTVMPLSSEQPSLFVKQEKSASTVLGSPSGTVKATPRSGEDASALVEDYAWWSLPGVVSPLQPATKRAQLDHPAAPREALQLADSDTMNWASDPSTPYSVSTQRAQTTGVALRKLKRRKIVALLATGGIAVIVGGAALELDRLQHLFGNTSHQAQTQADTAGKQLQTQTNTGQQMAKTPSHLQTQGHTGTVIGSTTMTLNSASNFTNPADAKGSLLIHLPGNRFVAYEKACTHEQVPVYYDHATKQLVCPAHGAIFDPAHGGAVVQGPAMRPLASVNIRVNSDGTITTG